LGKMITQKGYWSFPEIAVYKDQLNEKLQSKIYKIAERITNPK
jgi:hypothetical protein